MKQILLFVLGCYCFIFLACQDEKVTNPVLEIAEKTVLFTQKEGQREIAIKATQEWNAEVEDPAKEWCSVILSGSTLEIRVTENSGTQTRTAQVQLASAGLKCTVEVKQMGSEPTIELAESRVDLDYDVTEYILKIITNVDYEVVIDEQVDWVRLASIQLNTRTLETTCKFNLDKNSSEEKRFTEIAFKQKDGDFTTSILVNQLTRDKNYNPGDTEDVGDRKIKVARGEASQWQDKEGIELSFDDDASTHYHSPYYSTKLPVTLTYYFDQPESVDYIIYKPRTKNGTNGRWNDFKLQVASKESNTFQDIGNYKFEFSGDPQRITLDKQKSKITAVRFVVSSGTNNLVSCAEMEFYQQMSIEENLKHIFADDLYSELHAGVTQAQIDEIKNSFFRNIAQSLFDQTYNIQYRIQEYEPYRPIDDVSNELKTSGYCPFENATGIWFNNEVDVVVFVGETYGENISLKVYDFDGKRRGEEGILSPASYSLAPGINKFKLKQGGLAYIDYFTKNWEIACKIKIHIASGYVNGYFDRNKNTAAEWNDILNNTTYGCIDLKGNKINIIYSVEKLRAYCKNGLKLIEHYDEFVRAEHEICGLYKYDRVPKNHMFLRAVKEGMFADGWGVGFYEGIMDKLADENRVHTEAVWSIAHELGHVNQIRPNLKWIGTTEVTNNIYSICLRYERTPNNLNLEQERVNDGDGNYVLGGRFNAYLNYGIVKGEQWMYQKGQDNMTDYATKGGDHFVALCPIWQLLLYYRYIKEDKDWYARLSELARTTDASGLNDGQLQINFMRDVCDILKVDLTDFFIKTGMLVTCDRPMDDYAQRKLTITQAQYDNVIKHAAQYSKPGTPVLYYLTANSQDAYKNKRSVSGTPNQGVTSGSGTCTISHNVWKNVTVFETYAGIELTKVAMVGTDSSDRSSTLVRYPSGSTAIYAVAWDGKRTLVYGTSNGIENKI